MWNKFKALAAAGMFLVILATPVIAQVCAFPGKDGINTTVSSVVNTYYAGTGTASGTSVTLGTIRDAAKPAIAVGDLIILMQMQSGNGVSFSNSASYGSGVDAAAGRYEYATVKTVSGSTLTLAASLTYTYTQSVSSRQTYQIVRVPQYSSATVSGTVTAAAWNGTTGGVVALDTTGTLTFSGTIDVSGQGFRGGAGLQKTGDLTATTYATGDYFYESTLTFSGMKGEGIAGTPYKVNGGTSATTGADNYPGTTLPSSIGRGAPGNAGGGSNDYAPDVDNGLNAGGGGGSNGGTGGVGGNNWHNNIAANNPPNGFAQGGLGGSVFLATSSQIVMGGGGGAGDGNNSTTMNEYLLSGANGGGIVLIRAGSITGSGTINANGNAALDLPASGQTDSGGGGGAGGSIVISSVNGTSGLTANAKGGNGGRSGYFEHGPGGGGGGGFIAANGGVSTSVTKGIAGLDRSTTPKNYGATNGTDGVTTSSVTTTGTGTGASCLPALTVTKSTSTPGPFPSGGTATYTIQVANAATAGTTKAVRISDLRLPSGFTFASAGAFTASTGVYLTGTTTAATLAALATKPAVGNTSLNWDSLDIPAGGTVSITFTVNITAGTADGTYHNPAAVAYSDPTRSTAARVLKPFTNATTSTANGGTAYTTNTSYETGSFAGSVGGSNYDGTASGATTENVIISSIPSIALVKTCTAPATCETAQQIPGTDLSYKITFSNSGGVAAQSLQITDPIPTSTDYQVSPGAAVNVGSTGLTVVIEYSNNGGTIWTYTPTSGGGGAAANYDRNVTNIRWRASAGNLSAGTPGDVTFTVKIR